MTAVILFHVDIPFVRGGYTGVDIFFVLSGFLITSALREALCNGSFSFCNFYKRRVQRLFPALFVTLWITFSFATICFTNEDLSALSLATLMSIFPFSNILYWTQAGYFDSSASEKPLLHTWSLGVEEQFYLLWPALLFLLLYQWKLKPHRELFALTGTAIASLFACELVILKSGALAFFLTPFRVFEFICGAILWWLPLFRSANEKHVASVCGIALVMYSLLQFDSGMVFPGVTALVPCLGTALLIHSGPHTFIGNLLSTTALVHIGRVSYSLYLVHWPIIVFFKYITTHDVLQWSDVVLLLFMCYIAGVILHVTIERRYFTRPTQNTEVSLSNRASRFIDHKREKSKASLFPWAAFALALIILPLHCWISNGWSFRSRVFSKPLDINRTMNTDLGVTVEEFEDHIRDYQRTKRTRVFDKFGPITGSNQTSATRMLLLGDSLSHQLLGFAHYYGVKHNVKFHVWWYGSCPGLSTGYVVYDEGSFGADAERMEGICNEKRKGWFEELRRSNFSAVFLASRWTKFVEERKYGSFAQIPQMYFFQHGQESKKRNKGLEMMRLNVATALQQTTEQILNLGMKVILVSQVPDVGRSPRGCLSRPSFDFGIMRRGQPFWCVGADRVLARQRMEFTNRMIENISRHGVTHLIPTSYFCDNMEQDESFCRVVWQDKVLYRNQDHLTDFGSLWLAIKWERHFKRFVDNLSS